MPLDNSLITSYIGDKINDISKLQEDTEKRTKYFGAKNKICYEQLSRYNACSAALIVIKENKDIPDEIKADLCGILNSIKSDLDYGTAIGRQKNYIDLMRLVAERKQWYITITNWLITLQDAIT
jgi:hypothetical protein